MNVVVSDEFIARSKVRDDGQKLQSEDGEQQQECVWWGRCVVFGDQCVRVLG